MLYRGEFVLDFFKFFVTWWPYQLIFGQSLFPNEVTEFLWFRCHYFWHYLLVIHLLRLLCLIQLVFNIGHVSYLADHRSLFGQDLILHWKFFPLFLIWFFLNLWHCAYLEKIGLLAVLESVGCEFLLERMTCSWIKCTLEPYDKVFELLFSNDFVANHKFIPADNIHVLLSDHFATSFPRDCAILESRLTRVSQRRNDFTVQDSCIFVVTNKATTSFAFWCRHLEHMFVNSISNTDRIDYNFGVFTQVDDLLRLVNSAISENENSLLDIAFQELGHANSHL